MNSVPENLPDDLQLLKQMLAKMQSRVGFLEEENHAPLSGAFRRYRQLLTDSRLLGYASAGGFLYGGMYAFIAGTPFAHIDFYQISP